VDQGLVVEVTDKCVVKGHNKEMETINKPDRDKCKGRDQDSDRDKVDLDVDLEDSIPNK